MRAWIGCGGSLLILASLVGCKSIGPEAIRSSQSEFNCAIAASMDEQMLLNLVRLRYRDNAYFVEITNITDSRNLALEAGNGEDGALYVNAQNAATAVWNPLCIVSTGQSPTINYAPMQGEGFVHRFFSTVPLPTLLMMIQSGWSVDRVFSVFVERINGLRNVPTASGPTPLSVPDYHQFQRAVRLLGELFAGDAIAIGQDSNGAVAMEVRLASSDGQYESSLQEFRALLGVPSERNHFVFGNDFLPSADGDVKLRSRSMQGALFYLSHGIEIPQEHQKCGLVTMTRDSAGHAFQWEKVLHGLLRVHSSREKPARYFVATPYRGYWFFISDDDLQSKSTFMLLNNVFSLQSGNVSSFAPTLTISLR